MTIRRALIVDDSTTAQYRLKKMLRRYPLDIDIVDSGEAALRYLAHHAPDVIFMDHLMPGMDGFRALQIIKSHPETAMIPVIMYTSKSGDVYTGQARALGALDVVSKDRINATDLSKVMETINIFPNQPLDKSDTIESAELIAAANRVSGDPTQNSIGINEPGIERRAPNQAAVEQARNLELRLSHMEHSLEDNRRFITSRVVRELQGLRQNLRQEFSDILQQQPAATATANLPPPDAPTAPHNSRWPLVASLLSLTTLVVIGYFFWSIQQQLSESNAQQTALNAQLQSVTTQIESDPQLTALKMDKPTAVNADINQVRESTIANDRHFLEDLAWTFNQSAGLAFHQNTIDPKPVIRLHELLHRIASNNFKGTATITIYVGNFCVAIDDMGTAQLAKPEATLGDCMLSSEIYMLERVLDEYTREVNMILSNITRDPTSNLHIEITGSEGPDTYPERVPTVNARDWNQIAQNNNRIEIALTTAD
jgi:CheY-like chemotaxis protein